MCVCPTVVHNTDGTVQIIFSLYLQTTTIAQMLNIRGEGEQYIIKLFIVAK